MIAATTPKSSGVSMRASTSVETNVSARPAKNVPADHITPVRTLSNSRPPRSWDGGQLRRVGRHAVDAGAEPQLERDQRPQPLLARRALRGARRSAAARRPGRTARARPSPGRAGRPRAASAARRAASARAGTPKPCLGRSRIASGSHGRAAARSATLPSAPRRLSAGGRPAASSISSWSSSGERTSSDCAMLVTSTLASRSSAQVGVEVDAHQPVDVAERRPGRPTRPRRARADRERRQRRRARRGRGARRSPSVR